jgi:hypothetical protein
MLYPPSSLPIGSICFSLRAAITNKLTTAAIMMIYVARRPLNVAKGITSVYHSRMLAVPRAPDREMQDR